MKRPTLFWTQDPGNIGDFLRQVRIAKGIQAIDVAAHLGHTPGFVANVEAGRRLPSLPSMFKWAKFLGLQFMFQAVEDQ